MTDWDHAAAYANIGWEENQNAEGGANAGMNCVPTSFCDVALALSGGTVNFEPQPLTDVAFGVGWHGGTDYQSIERVMRAQWPQMPAIVYSSPIDTIAEIDNWGSQGYPVMCSFWCDGPGNIITYSMNGWQHVSPVVAHHGGQVFVFQAESSTIVTLSEADFRAATNGPSVGALAIWQQKYPGGGDELRQEEANEIEKGGLEMALHIIRPEVTPDQVQAFMNGWWPSFGPLLGNYAAVLHAILTSGEGVAEALREAGIDKVVAAEAAEGTPQAPAPAKTVLGHHHAPGDVTP